MLFFDSGTLTTPPLSFLNIQNIKRWTSTWVGPIPLNDRELDSKALVYESISYTTGSWKTDAGKPKRSQMGQTLFDELSLSGLKSRLV